MMSCRGVYNYVDMVMAVATKDMRDALTRAEMAIQDPARKVHTPTAIEAFGYLEAFALSKWDELSERDREVLAALAYLVIDPPKLSLWRSFAARLKYSLMLLLGLLKIEDFTQLYAAANSYADTVLTLIEQSDPEYQNTVADSIKEALKADHDQFISLGELRERVMAD